MSGNYVGASFSSCSTPAFADVYPSCSGSGCTVTSIYNNGVLDGKSCYCSGSGTWSSYDDAAIMTLKAQKVSSLGYGGVLVWSIPGDYQNKLTDGVSASILPSFFQTAAGNSNAPSGLAGMTLAEFVTIVP